MFFIAESFYATDVLVRRLSEIEWFIDFHFSLISTAHDCSSTSKLSHRLILLS